MTNRLPPGTISMRSLVADNCQFYFLAANFGFSLNFTLADTAYNVAAQRALLHRLGRAHSHEGVTSSIAPLGYYQPATDDTGKVPVF